MEKNKNELSRRKFIEIGSVAAATTAGVLLTGPASAQSSTPGVKTGRSTSLTDPGPTDKSLDSANPDSYQPPLSDAGGVPTFKYPFSLSNKRVYEGGWSREVTVRELPVSKTMAGVNMRLNAGGVRECTGTQPPNVLRKREHKGLFCFLLRRSRSAKVSKRNRQRECTER